jgi:nicotinate phosphoribosyltransferase
MLWKENLALNTDLYELTMAQIYLEKNYTGKAVFSLFVRELPKERNFLVVGGVNTLLELLSGFQFSKEDLSYLKSLGIFKDWFLDWLEEFSFKGNIYIIDDGRIIFQREPIIQVEADLPTAQILETFIMNIIHFETLIASKASRIYGVAKDKILIDFGLRRAHGFQAGLLAAKNALICGFKATSNLLAGKIFNIPVSGTMAHSFIMVFGEEEAFKIFHKFYPNKAIFLVDTYDVIKAIEKTIELAKKGYKPIGVRIDSGDIPFLVKEVRKRLDSAGLKDIKIFVSGGVDEYKIEEWKNLPIDGYGVGTKFITSSDRPYLDIAYKLVEYENQPKFKLSQGKITYPFKKQVLRFYDSSSGLMTYDRIERYEELENKKTTGEKLVKLKIKNGKLLGSLENWSEIRERFLEEFSLLPKEFKQLKKVHYKVEISPQIAIFK